MGNEFGAIPVAQLVAGFRSGAFSPVEVATAMLDRIARFNPELNAFTYVDAEGALASARQSEERWQRGRPLGALDGVPVTVKELLAARGWPLRRCSRATPEDATTDYDAPCVARLREQGTVLLGKTNSPEFGWKGVTDNPLYGITRNPWNPARTAGGSSGGAAVAAALGLGTLHLGTDGGGSIRIPAAFTGVFGLKPTYGRVAVYPPSSFGTLSHVGPMARTAEDAAYMLRALAQRDVRDYRALPVENVDYVAQQPEPITGLRIAYSPTLGFARVDREIADIVARAVRVFEGLGARVVELDRIMSDPTDTFRTLWSSGLALILRGFPREARRVMDPGLVALAEFGESVEHLPYLEAEYSRGILGAKMNALHEQYDLLLTPAEPIAALSAGRQTAERRQRDWIDWTPFTFPFNLTGQPAASIPCGLTAAGLPVGLQVVGGHGRDDLVLRACAAFERACPPAAVGDPNVSRHDSP
jgi:aspartyl-tRNA(Asn)/glutamyl-tRNA(Gln) amidotransferase subunit A